MNLSFKDILDTDFVSSLDKNLDKIDNENKDRIVFEILESDYITDYTLLEDFIMKYRNQGIKIAIDDFGTGYSNFERLVEYQPDILKIDGSLIKNILTSPYNRNIIETIVVFAQKQHIKTVAEFVENEDIFLAVKEMGIDFSQGYAFGKPELF